MTTKEPDTERTFLHAELTREVLGCAFEVHSLLGPGLLESVYRTCLARELSLRGFAYATEALVPIRYKGNDLDAGYRADLIVEQKLLVELKSVERLLPIHEAQLMTYLRLAEIRVGLLINFNVSSLRNGIRRLAK